MHTIGIKNISDTKQLVFLNLDAHYQQEKRPVISVLRSFARPQADGKLKNDLFVQENSFELTMIFFS